MRSVNKVILLGVAGKDAEHVRVGTYDLVKFSLATSRRWKKQNGEEVEETEWHLCEKWGSPGMANIIKKGTKVYVEGRIQTEEYTDKDGHKRRITKIAVDEWSAMTTAPKRQETHEYDDAPF